MKEFTVTRLAYEGCDPSDTWIITGIGHSKIDMENVDIMNVSSLSEYESGCQEHEKCLGHLCKTPYGNILPMQSLAISTPVIRNDIYKAAQAAFEGPGQYYRLQYKTILEDSMKKKTGRMRKGVLNCHVDGSLRMVVGPQTTLDFNVVTIPHYLKDKWAVVYLDKSTNKYKSRYVREGDWAILIRPPSLTLRSVQPCKISFWKETYMGVSPDLIKAFDGDFDGDEMHLDPVCSEEAIKECENWSITINKGFELARSIYSNSSIPFKDTSPYGFMESTTMSFQEIKIGQEQPLMSEQSRVEKSHIDTFRNRFNTDKTSRSFPEESMRGMADTNSQQLSQPIVGDMSRIAKLASANVIHKEDGTIGMCTYTDFVPICNFKKDSQRGSSCMRAMSVICANTQQSKLQSHHAKKALFPAHDIISDIILGESKTVVLIDNSLGERQIRLSMKPSLYDRTEHGTFIICSPKDLRSIPKIYIKGSYNPIVLSMIQPNKRLEVCETMITYATAYFELALSETEIRSLAVLFSYEVHLSPLPITTRDGITARNLRWTEVTMANHYTGLTESVNRKDIEFSSIETVSACLMAGNFRELSQ